MDGTPLTKKECKILGEKRYYIGDKTKISGLRKKEQDKNAIEREEEIKVKRIIGLAEGLKRGDITQIGAFEEEEIS